MKILSENLFSPDGPAVIDLQQQGGIATSEDAIIPASYWLDLQDAKQLPKPVYSYSVDLAVLREPKNFEPLKHYVRITGSLGIGDRGWGYTPDDWILANSIVFAARDFRSDVGLTINTFPYQRTGNDNPNPDDWSKTGKEIAYTAEFLEEIKTLGLSVTGIAFDSELYQSPHPDVTRRLNLMYELAKTFYLEACFIWYRNGDWSPLLDVKSDNKAIVQYWITSAKETEQRLDFWYAHASHNEEDWTIWTNMGAGYDDDGVWQWKRNLNLENYRWLARQHMNDARVKRLVFFPHPFRPRTMPESIKGFLAYVEGANKT